MAGLDRTLLAEKAAAIERHLARVEVRLPADPEDLAPATDASDAVILHLWQAVQGVIDLAMAACLRFGLPTPENYGDAFLRLADAGRLPADLAARLVAAAGFRNRIVHGYARLDLFKVHRIAREGPADLRAFLAALRDTLAQ